jgi:hypothetical protein
MTTKRKTRSRILAAVHETARDLHRLGFIDKRKMRKYDVPCLEPVPKYDAAINPRAARGTAAEPGRSRLGVRYEPFDRAQMGGRRQEAERPLARAAEPH